MSYVLVEDVPASWERYEVVARSLAWSAPGLLLHVAGPTDEGFRIVEVWESEDAWRDFAPAFDRILDAVDPDLRPRAAIRGLHPSHLVLGEPWAVQPGTGRDMEDEA